MGNKKFTLDPRDRITPHGICAGIGLHCTGIVQEFYEGTTPFICETKNSARCQDVGADELYKSGLGMTCTITASFESYD